jgi:osmotically-inducible protein OsmY
VHATEIGVAVKDGVVTLSGSVDSYAKRWAAEEAAHRVRGVKAVADEIEVRLSGDGRRTDEEIAEAAAHALEWDPLIPADRIKVTVANGFVTLEGTVDWQYEREDAAHDVHHLTGVKGVSNLITLTPRPVPASIHRNIEDALVRTARSDADHIAAAVSGSKVTLSGTVHSWGEREEAARQAWSAPGVTSVDNRITIAP